MQTQLASASVVDFSEFPIPSYEDWVSECETALNGASFDKKLITQTPEGIRLQPIYHRWDVESIGDSEFRMAPVALTDDVEDIPYGRYPTVRSLLPVLTALDLQRCKLYLEAENAPVPVLALAVASLRELGHEPTDISGFLVQDPLSQLVLEGTLPVSLETAFRDMALTTSWSQREMPDLRSIAVQTHTYHNAGATAVQELAFAMATALEYLRAMEAHELDLAEVASRIHFAFSIGPEFFMGIAKFRAARELWSQVLNRCGCDHPPMMWIHARTSRWNRSRLDPYVNLLRGTTEAFAAIAGGCNSLQVGPYDEVVRPSNEFSRRLARNTTIILRDECYLGRVTDPASGSYYVETLTHELAEKSWHLFQEIEGLGGMHQALSSGSLQEWVLAARSKRTEAIARRRQSLIGVNQYANPMETPLSNLPQEVAEATSSSPEENQLHVAILAQLGAVMRAAPSEIMDLSIVAAARGASIEELCHTLRHHELKLPHVVSLPQERAAEPFEQLRTAVERAGRPGVFLATMGPLRQHKARADFSTGFFEVGGFRIISDGAFSTSEEAAQAAAKHEARVVVLCSTDETYPEIVTTLVPILRKENPSVLIVLAGYPTEQVETFRTLGVDEFIHLKANCYETLVQIAARLGIAP